MIGAGKTGLGVSNDLVTRQQRLSELSDGGGTDMTRCREGEREREREGGGEEREKQKE